MRNMSYPDVPNWQLDRWYTANIEQARKCEEDAKLWKEKNNPEMAHLSELMASVSRLAAGHVKAELEYRKPYSFT